MSPEPPSETPQRRRTGGLWWQRDFRLLWTGETISELGSTVTFVALPLLAVTVLHVSTLAVGVLAAAGWLPALVSLPAGAWVDRLARRPLMLGCDAVSLLAYASVPIAGWFCGLTYTQLLAVALIGGIARTVFRIAFGAYLPVLVSRERLAEGNAKLDGSARAAEIGGRGLGGLLAQLLGPATALLADAASFALAALCLLGIRTPEPPRHAAAGRSTVRREIVEGLRFVTRDPYLRVLVGFIAVANLALIGLLSLEVVFLVRTVGEPPAVIGGLVAATSAGGVLGAFFATRIGGRLGTARGLITTVAVTFPLGLLVPLTTQGPGLAFLIAGYLATGAGVTIAGIICRSFWQTYCPPRLLGRVIATLRFLTQGCVPLGALLAGTLGDVLGNRAALWIIAGCFVLAGIFLAVSPISRHVNLPVSTTTSAEHPD